MKGNRILGSHVLPKYTTKSLLFRIEATKSIYIFSYMTEKGRTWESLGQISNAALIDYDFTGSIFGIFASTRALGAASRRIVIFEAF